MWERAGKCLDSASQRAMWCSKAEIIVFFWLDLLEARRRDQCLPIKLRQTRCSLNQYTCPSRSWVSSRSVWWRELKACLWEWERTPQERNTQTNEGKWSEKQNQNNTTMQTVHYSLTKQTRHFFPWLRHRTVMWHWQSLVTTCQFGNSRVTLQ